MEEAKDGAQDVDIEFSSSLSPSSVTSSSSLSSSSVPPSSYVSVSRSYKRMDDQVDDLARGWSRMDEEERRRTIRRINEEWKSSLSSLPVKSPTVVKIGQASLADDPSIILLDVNAIGVDPQLRRRRPHNRSRHRNSIPPHGNESKANADTTGTAALFVNGNADTTGTATASDRCNIRIAKHHDSAPRWNSCLAGLSAALADNDVGKICIDKIDLDVRNEIEKYRRQLYEAANVDACGSDFTVL